MKITNNATMFLKVYGRLFKVEHVAKTIQEANEFCAKNLNMGVLSEGEDGLVYICDINDKGIDF